jgi:hypothetical protein
MPQINLRVYIDPGRAEIFCNALRLDGGYETFVAVVDTGAEVSLLPNDLKNVLDFQIWENADIELEQAGLARQIFRATRANITLFFEDTQGNKTIPALIPVWFADTRQPLIGFAGVLDKAILQIDMLQNAGWLYQP